MRADAAQNRIRLLAAANSVFQDAGIDASLEEIADCAGVSRTTLFRHFPDRQALLAALLKQATENLEIEAAGLQGEADALFTLLFSLSQGILAKPAVVDYWWSASQDNLDRRKALERTAALFDGPIRRAVAAGLCRPDLTSSDIVLIAPMLSGPLRIACPQERAAMALRILEIVTDGVRKRGGLGDR